MATARELFNSVNNTLDEIEKDESIWQETPEGKKACEKRLEELRATWAASKRRGDTASWIGMVVGIILATILSATIMGGLPVVALGVGAVIIAVFLMMKAEMAEYDYLGFVFLVVTQLAIFWAGRTTLSSVRAGLSVGAWVMADIVAILVLVGCVATWRKVIERQKGRDSMCARINRLLEKGVWSNKVQETGQ